MNTTTLAPTTPTLTSTRCEHQWSLASRHRTSEGTLSYSCCPQCSAWQVVLSRAGASVPEVQADVRSAPAPLGLLR